MAHSPSIALLVVTGFQPCGAVDPSLGKFLKWKKPEANDPIGGVSLAQPLRLAERKGDATHRRS